MSDARDMGVSISQRDVQDAALLFAVTHKIFSAKEFTEFLQIQAHSLEEEPVNDLLTEMAARGQLREIGPGVYGKPVCTLRDSAAAPGGPRIWGQP